MLTSPLAKQFYAKFSAYPPSALCDPEVTRMIAKCSRLISRKVSHDEARQFIALMRVSMLIQF